MGASEGEAMRSAAALAAAMVAEFLGASFSGPVRDDQPLRRALLDLGAEMERRSALLTPEQQGKALAADPPTSPGAWANRSAELPFDPGSHHPKGARSKSRPKSDPAEMPYGKYRGRPVDYVASLDPSYLEWFLTTDPLPKYRKGVEDALARAGRGRQLQR